MRLVRVFSIAAAVLLLSGGVAFADHECEFDDDCAGDEICGTGLDGCPEGLCCVVGSGPIEHEVEVIGCAVALDDAPPPAGTWLLVFLAGLLFVHRRKSRIRRRHS